jgi:hypothetical protein
LADEEDDSNDDEIADDGHDNIEEMEDLILPINTVPEITEKEIFQSCASASISTQVFSSFAG